MGKNRELSFAQSNGILLYTFISTMLAVCNSNVATCICVASCVALLLYVASAGSIDFRRPPEDLSTRSHPPTPPTDRGKYNHDSTGLKVYIYDLPEVYTYADASASEMDSWEYMYAHEHVLHQRILQSHHRTLDPNQADYFWVPLKSCMAHAQRTTARGVWRRL